MWCPVAPSGNGSICSAVCTMPLRSNRAYLEAERALGGGPVDHPLTPTAVGQLLAQNGVDPSAFRRLRAGRSLAWPNLNAADAAQPAPGDAGDAHVAGRERGAGVRDVDARLQLDRRLLGPASPHPVGIEGVERRRQCQISGRVDP